MPLSIVVYSGFMFVLLVYATSIYTKHSFTSVPKIFLDMRVAHMGNKLYIWFTLYRLAMLTFISILQICTVYNTGVFDMNEELFSFMEFSSESLTQFFHSLLDNLFSTVYCSEEVDSKNMKKLEIITTNSMRASRSMMMGMGTGTEGYVTPMLTAQSYSTVFHETLD
jgi:hypothetical protein